MGRTVHHPNDVLFSLHKPTSPCQNYNYQDCSIAWHPPSCNNRNFLHGTIAPRNIMHTLYTVQQHTKQLWNNTTHHRKTGPRKNRIDHGTLTSGHIHVQLLKTAKHHNDISFTPTHISHNTIFITRNKNYSATNQIPNIRRIEILKLLPWRYHYLFSQPPDISAARLTITRFILLLLTKHQTNDLAVSAKLLDPGGTITHPF